MPWLVVALVGFVLVQALSRPQSSPGAPPPPPGPPAPPRPPGGPGGHTPHFAELGPPVPEALELEPGTTYLAQAEIPFLLGALVGQQQIREALEREGFVVIRTSEERPDFWPSDDVADWYIVASYSGDRKPRNVPSGITRLWQAVAAPGSS